MSDKPTEQKIDKEQATDEAAKKPEEPLSDADLNKVVGGMGEGFHKPDRGIVIEGPSWVKTMAYREAEWDADPARKRPVTEIFEELAAEAADDE